MFVDKNWEKKQQHGDGYKKAEDRLSPNNILFIILGFLLFAAFAGSILILVLKRPISTETSKNNPSNQQDTQNIPATSSLPLDIGNGDGNGDGNGININDIKAEDLTFGLFYKEYKDDFKPTAASYGLPLNIKTDVLNYYDVSRKINLDPYIDDLNENGFSILKKSALDETDNFFDTYRYLSKNGIPLFITNDFIFYYYQNTLKNIFKEIEKNAFYENIWNINKSLLDKAVIRYRQRLDLIGNINDPVLEAERLEVAYFAVALKLLMPESGQINRKTDFVDVAKFNQQEADWFSFNIPNFLEADIEKEVKLIRESKGTVKSPILLYPVSYSTFSVPNNYKDNAKLNNFYLATKWFNSVFPLYYKSDACPDCLLDHDDWVINLGAASLISKDMYDNQELKNQWAVVYKIISFFNGLRSDLTYLHYNGALTELFGSGYDVESIFDENNSQREADFANIRDKIAEYDFLDIEGSMDRGDAGLKPWLGMRMLQQPFWPNDYLLNYLSGEELLIKGDKSKDQSMTICSSKKVSASYRCRGFGLDIVNLFYPIRPDYDYFNVNTDYYNYDERHDELKKQINYFDVSTWNSNVYWMTLDISKKLAGYSRENMPVFMSKGGWEEENDFNTILGGWVNLHLDADILGIYEGTGEAGGLDMGHGCDMHNYIEPNIGFVEELIAKNNMLIDMFAALKITKKTNTASIELRELNGKFEQIVSIMKKELSGEAINDDDCAFIEDFSQHYIVEKDGGKNFSIKFDDGSINESINGIKPMSVIYKNGDKKILTVGPVFNYQEK